MCTINKEIINYNVLRRYNTMSNKKILIVFVSISFIIGCSLHPKVKSNEAYVRIKPIAPLSELDNSSLPDNLIIIVDNVADMNNSYKNRLILYINKYLIEPDEVYNYKNTYKYNLKLQPGVYKVKAVYYAHSGWTEQGFDIKTRENVKIFLDKKAILKVKLEKNHWGAPVDKVTYFDVKYEPLSLK